MNSAILHIVEAQDPSIRRDTTDREVCALVDHLATDPEPGTVRIVLLCASTRGESRAWDLGLRTPNVMRPICGGYPIMLSRRRARKWTFPEGLPIREVCCWSPTLAALSRQIASDRNARWTDHRLALAEGSGKGERFSFGDRQRLRRELDVGATDLLVALAADPVSRVEGLDFLKTLSTLSLVGHRPVGLVERGVPDLARARWLVRAAGLSVRLRVVTRPVRTLVAACDALVLDVREGGRPHTPDLLACRSFPSSAPSFISQEFRESLHDRPLVSFAASRLPAHIARAIDARVAARELSSRSSREVDSAVTLGSAMA